MALTDKLTAIANAIRAKTGDTGQMTLEQMATAIASIGGGSGSSIGVKTGTITPTEKQDTISIDTGLSTINNIILFSTIARNGTCSYKFIKGMFIFKNIDNASVINSNSSGSSASASNNCALSDVTYYVDVNNGGVFTYVYYGAFGYFAPVEYTWFAW